MMRTQSVNGLEARHRVDAWEEIVSSAFVPMRAVPIARVAFNGQIRSHELGPLQLVEVSADAEVVQRTPRLISDRDPEYYKVGVQLRGRGTLVQDGRQAALVPGDLAVYDTTRPYRLAFDESFRMLVVMFPRTLLRLPCDRMAGLTAVPFSGRSPLGGLVTPFLGRLLDRVVDLDEPSAVRLGDNVLDLLSTTFAQHLDLTDHLGEETRGRALLQQTYRFIEKHLSDPELAPGTIAGALHISTRYLHKLFEVEGTTAGAWIRQRRMERCRRDLADPNMAAYSVSAIGARWGLTDPSRMSRLFRQSYGMSPREYRAHVAGTDRTGLLLRDADHRGTGPSAAHSGSG